MTEMSTLFSIIPLVGLFLGLVAIGLAIWSAVKISALLRGSDGKSLEGTIKAQGETLDKLLKFRNESIEYFKFLDSRIKNKVGKVETVRFNPFQGVGIGGDNSFSTALVDEEGNGVVISGLHTRERTNVFAKPISAWDSKHELSQEEKGVIEKSRGKGK